jgi:hypothetical protein
LTLGRKAVAAEVSHDRIQITLDDGTVRTADHVILATGFRFDMKKYAFLSDELLDRMVMRDGCPRLERGFESTVRGLHVLGAPSHLSYSPLTRFVAGSGFAARLLAEAVTRQRKE